MTRRFQHSEWRPLFLRETAEQRLWPATARGLRDYFIRIAEHDGRLLKRSDDPSGDLVRLVGAHDFERAAIAQSVVLLLQDGFLAWEGPGTPVCVDRLQDALGSRPKPDEGDEPPAAAAEPSKEERRRQGARQRQQRRRNRGRDTERDKAPETGVTVTRDKGRDTERDVTPSSSPGSPSFSEKHRENTGGGNARARDAVTTSKRDNERDTPERDKRDATALDESAVSTPTLATPTSPDQALALPIAERARAVVDHPHSAQWVESHRWPEVVAVATAFNAALNRPAPLLQSYHTDPAVRTLVEAFAAGYTQQQLERAAKAFAVGEFARKSREAGKRPTLAWLKGDLLRTEVEALPVETKLSPRVEAAIARAQVQEVAR